MGIRYTNIKKDYTLAFDTDYIPYKKDELIREFEYCIKAAGITKIEWQDRKESPYKCSIVHNEKKYCLYMYLKNVSGAGWENKPWMKRVQVPNIRIQHPDYYVMTKDTTTMLIVGYYNYDDNPIFVAWDAYGYVMHSTVRSCYVEVDDLLRGYRDGYYKGSCSGQTIWVFRPKYICDFLEEYIKQNSVEVH